LSLWSRCISELRFLPIKGECDERDEGKPCLSSKRSTPVVKVTRNRCVRDVKLAYLILKTLKHGI
jgi:hypothetical protein